jgi:hypothetical protein
VCNSGFRTNEAVKLLKMRGQFWRCAWGSHKLLTAKDLHQIPLMYMKGNDLYWFLARHPYVN